MTRGAEIPDVGALNPTLLVFQSSVEVWMESVLQRSVFENASPVVVIFLKLRNI